MLVDPDSTWVMVTSAPETGLPSVATTRPATADVVVCASAGTDPRASATHSATRDMRKLMGLDMVLPFGVVILLRFSFFVSCAGAGRLPDGAPLRGRSRRGGVTR